MEKTHIKKHVLKNICGYGGMADAIDLGSIVNS